MVIDIYHEDWIPPLHLLEIGDEIEKHLDNKPLKTNPKYKLFKERFNLLVKTYNGMSKHDNYKKMI